MIEFVTYWFYDALCAGEHGAHDGKVLGVRHPPLAHVFEDFSRWRGFQGVFGVEANIGIDACSENTKCSSEDKPCGEQKTPEKSQHSSQVEGNTRYYSTVMWEIC